MKFIELVDKFKSSEGDIAENLIMIMDDSSLRGGLLAWQSMIIDCPDYECAENKDIKEEWDWLWLNIKIDYKKFACIANIKEYEAINLINRLKALRLIYPDGTINKYARAYMRKIVTDKLPVKKD